MENKQKRKNTTPWKQLHNPISKSLIEEKICTPNTQMHDRSLSWFKVVPYTAGNI